MLTAIAGIQGWFFLGNVYVNEAARTKNLPTNESLKLLSGNPDDKC